MALFTLMIGVVAFRWRRPAAGVFPSLIRFRYPILVLMLVVEYNGFLSFGTKVEDKFSKLLNINDVLIVQPIRIYSTKLALRFSLLSVRDL